MEKVKLVFSDAYNLERFASIIYSDHLEMDLAELTLVCNCGDAEVELAAAFGGKVIEQEGP